jgi:hypothetical protein
MMRIKAATLALFPANLYTQALLQFKNASVKRPADWDQVATLPEQCLEELRWWLTNLSKNVQSLLPHLSSHTIYVDASNLGWEAFIKVSPFKVSGLKKKQVNPSIGES